MKRCPFCAAEVKHGAAECPACKKSFGRKAKQDNERSGPTSLDTYEKTMVPWWLVIIVVGIFLLGFALIFVG